MNDWQGWLYVAAVLIPLAAFTIQFLGGRWLGRLNAYIATLAIGTSFVLSFVGFLSYLAANPGMFSSSHRGGEGAHGVAHHGPGFAFTGNWDWVVIGEKLGGSEAVGKTGSTAPLSIPLGIYIDNLAVLMFVMVSFIATLIHIYSMGYMKDDPRYPRFFTYLSLFCFSMLGLVASSSIFMVFVFWELVGVCSYLLIGFWYEDKKNSDAANKAFIVNRVGDVGMLMGLGLLWSSLGTFNIHEINTGLRDQHGQIRVVPEPQTGKVFAELGDPESREFFKPLIDPATGLQRRIELWVLTLAGLGIFAGCVGKSAQFPLHVWLPDAMAGPTPVSALIHAATMVAAGVYLVGRFFPVFTSEVLLYIAYTGGVTLFIAATIAMVQTDYKKVLAYSTVSQLGFMMLGLGVGGWAAGLFHLITHAFFKALLFLGAGSVYHAVHTYEMPVLGGLRKKMKITAGTMLVGTLAISGVPFFSGFYSKDAILANALYFIQQHPQHILLFVLPSVGACITAFYMFRLYFLVFEGTPRGVPATEHAHGHGHDDHAHGHHSHHGNPVEHAHESEPSMTWPLIILAIFAAFIGWPITLGIPFFGYEPVLERMLAYGEPIEAVDISGVKYWAMGGSVLIAAAGIAAAYVFYSPRRKLDPALAVRGAQPLHVFLVNKWYFDELYHAVFVRPALALARAASGFDRWVIDGVVNGSAGITVILSKLNGFFDRFAVDGIVNGIAWLVYLVGDWGRSVQTGRLRNYLMILAVAVVVMCLGIFVWIRPTLAG